jgi:uroporphyrinogen decarboxylase
MAKSSIMTSRERVTTALEHRSPDRVPRNFWAEEPTWRRLLEYVGHSDRDRLLDDLDIDIRHIEAQGPSEQSIGAGFYQNMWGERYIYKDTPWGPMREDTRGALAEAQSIADLKGFDWPTPDQFDYSTLAEQCARYESRALQYGFADIWQRPSLVRGMESMFLDMVMRPDWVHFLGRKFTDFYKEDYTRAAEATQGRIDLFLVISDLGGQSGPMISLDMFREFIAPYLKEMADCIHGFGARALYHSCGAIGPFIPDLIELGIDVLDPIQPVNTDMFPETLKSNYQGQLCFHGGIDMQHLLPKGTPDEIRREAERYCSVLGAEGGYILCPAHLFQPDVPPENILALYDGTLDA